MDCTSGKELQPYQLRKDEIAKCSRCLCYFRELSSDTSCNMNKDVRAAPLGITRMKSLAKSFVCMVARDGATIRAKSESMV